MTTSPNQKLFDLIENLTGKVLVQSELNDIINCVKKDCQPLPHWMPIATAPKDGTYVLICHEGHRLVYEGSFNHGCWDIRGSEDIEYRPTHWMPLLNSQALGWQLIDSTNLDLMNELTDGNFYLFGRHTQSAITGKQHFEYHRLKYVGEPYDFDDQDGMPFHSWELSDFKYFMRELPQPKGCAQ